MHVADRKITCCTLDWTLNSKLSHQNRAQISEINGRKSIWFTLISASHNAHSLRENTAVILNYIKSLLASLQKLCLNIFVCNFYHYSCVLRLCKQNYVQKPCPLHLTTACLGHVKPLKQEKLYIASCFALRVLWHCFQYN